MMLGGLKLFSQTIRLQISQEKYEIYLIRMCSAMKERIAQLTGFRLGSLPFRYIRVPIIFKKMKKV